MRGRVGRPDNIHGVSRRRILSGGAALAAGAATRGLWLPKAQAAPGDPPGAILDAKPIKASLVPVGGVGPHVAGPGTGAQNSTVFDFTGAVAGSEIRGLGVYTPQGSPPMTVEFDADVRVMKGRIVDRAGREQEGAFAFL